MKEDVSVCVCGVQRCPGAEEDVSELVCEGVFKHTAKSRRRPAPSKHCSASRTAESRSRAAARCAAR